MIAFIFLVTFLIYHFIVFAYGGVILSSKNKKWEFIIITALLNGTLFVLYYVFSFHEGILFIVFAIVLATEFYVGYKQERLKCLFGSLFFATNFFAVRLVIVAVCALYTKQSFDFFVMNTDANLECTIVAFIICSLYIIVFRYTLANRYIITIQNNENNVKFATKILFCIFAFQIFNTINGYVTDTYPLLAWLQLKIAVCVIFGFCAALLYAYLLSRLDVFKDVSKVMEKQIMVQQKESKHLENMAYIDQDLDCYSRVYGLRYLEDTIKMEIEYFSIIYFDVDGLKAVNDKYGHLEGDCYIKNIVTILKNVFQEQVLCRMGGDEFMVTLRNTNEFDAYKLAIRVYESIEDRNKEIMQPYPMSLSYGVLEVNKESELTSGEILKIVDKKMYAFKKSKKKARFM